MSSPTQFKRIAVAAMKVVMPILVLLGAARIAKTLIENRPEPERQERVDTGLLVETERVHVTPQRIDVTGEGTVVPSREVVLSPQVTGQVTWVSASMTAGGIVNEGDELVRVDPRNYRNNVELRRAELNRAEAAFTLERGRQVVAEQEWSMFAEELPADPEGRALALREPQLRDAEQVVEMAETALGQARLDLRRTTLSAPFNALVQTEAVEVGQVVGAGTRIANLVGTDVYWVRVSVPFDRLGYVEIPGVNASVGSAATVTYGSSRQRITREGQVVRLLPDLDPMGRMARLLVAVEDPLRLSVPPDRRGLPLLIGSFVSVTIEGSRSDPLIELPRVALREGSLVYVMNGDRELEIREVEVVWGRPQSVLIGAGLQDGEEVIVSRIGTAVPGTRLRRPGDPVPGEGTGEGPGDARAPVGTRGDGDEQSSE